MREWAPKEAARPMQPACTEHALLAPLLATHAAGPAAAAVPAAPAPACCRCRWRRSRPPPAPHSRRRPAAGAPGRSLRGRQLGAGEAQLKRVSQGRTGTMFTAHKLVPRHTRGSPTPCACGAQHCRTHHGPPHRATYPSPPSHPNPQPQPPTRRTRGQAAVGGGTVRNAQPALRKQLLLLAVQHDAVGKPAVAAVPPHLPAEGRGGGRRHANGWRQQHEASPDGCASTALLRASSASCAIASSFPGLCDATGTPCLTPTTLHATTAAARRCATVPTKQPGHCPCRGCQGSHLR